MPLDETCLYLFWAGFFEVDVQGVTIDLGDFAIAELLVEDALAHLKIRRHCFFRNHLAFNGFGVEAFAVVRR